MKLNYSVLIQQYMNENNKSIQILYDKDELKNEKRMKKAIKTINQLDFSKNRMNYYKNENNKNIQMKIIK